MMSAISGSNISVHFDPSRRTSLLRPGAGGATAAAAGFPRGGLRRRSTLGDPEDDAAAESAAAAMAAARLAAIGQRPSRASVEGMLGTGGRRRGSALGDEVPLTEHGAEGEDGYGEDEAEWQAGMTSLRAGGARCVHVKLLRGAPSVL